MNVEEERLQTFRDWPGNAAVEPRRIAQAGFYFTGSGLEVTCFSCGCQISDWNYGDQVMTRHRSLNPDCAFVKDPGSSGNVPLITTHSSTSQSNSPSRRNRTDGGQVGRWESETSVYRSERARLDSFEGWPIPFIVTPDDLAKAGFYFLRQGDKVQCAFCLGIICHWEQGDIPEAEHRRHFPECAFLLGLPVGNIRFFQHSSRTQPGNELCDTEDFEKYGIQRHRGPKHSEYSTVESRLRTFSGWPSDITQKPPELAEAGFYYVGQQPNGFRDHVRCFHCDGGLKRWEPEDDPWKEHAAWFPNCPFLLLVKGQDFVNEVQRTFSSGEPHPKPPAEVAGTSHSNSSEVKTATSTLQGGLSVSMPSLLNPPPSEASETISRTQSVSESLSLEEENRILREARQCKICMDAEVGAVLLPCGHLVACVVCAPNLRDCPICRQQIKSTIRTFLS